jgi:hypothetical protein
MIRVGGNRTMDDCHNIIALHLISEPTSSLQSITTTSRWGQSTKKRIFLVDNHYSSLIMKCATHEGATEVIQPMLKKGAKMYDEREKEMAEYSLETIKPPGLRPINQVELYKKCRPYVPRQY